MNTRCEATAEYTWTGDLEPSQFRCEKRAGHVDEHHQLTASGSFTWPNVEWIGPRVTV